MSINYDPRVVIWAIFWSYDSRVVNYDHKVLNKIDHRTFSRSLFNVASTSKATDNFSNSNLSPIEINFLFMETESASRHAILKTSLSDSVITLIL